MRWRKGSAFGRSTVQAWPINAACLVFLATILTLSACKQRRESPMEIPIARYDKPRHIAGKASWGMEDVWIMPCLKPQDECEILAAEDFERLPFCALEFSDNGYRDLQKLDFDRDETGAPQGEVWVEGIGQWSTNVGRYGHLSQHPCEIRFDRVVAIRRGPPWIYEPPPCPDGSFAC